MKSLYPLSGIISIVHTPFDERDRLDPEALAASVEERIQDGASGLIVPAVASEVTRLTLDEKRLMVRTVVDAAGGRAPVVAGATSPSLEESQAMARFALETGCVGILSQPLAAQAQANDEPAMLAYYQALAATGVPMLIVQDLAWSGMGLSIDFIGRLFEAVEPFRCLKVEVTPSGPKISQIIQATDNRLNVFGGWSPVRYLEMLDRGVHGYNPTVMIPIFVRLWKLHRAGRRAEAETIFERLLPILVFTTQHLDVSIQFNKLLYRRKGIFRTARLRPPVTVPYDALFERLAGELVERTLALEDEARRAERVDPLPG